MSLFLYTLIFWPVKFISALCVVEIYHVYYSNRMRFISLSDHLSCMFPTVPFYHYILLVNSKTTNWHCRNRVRRWEELQKLDAITGYKLCKIFWSMHLDSMGLTKLRLNISPPFNSLSPKHHKLSEHSLSWNNSILWCVRFVLFLHISI